LFADGKDKSLSPVVLEIPKPETADFEFGDIDENSESTFTDIKIGQYLDDDSEPADLNLDLETHEHTDEGDSLLDHLISELDDSPETDESGRAGDDESLEINLDATTDDFDPALTIDLEAAEDELKASIADEVEGDDDVIDLDFGEEEAIQFTMGEDILGDDLAPEQFSPIDSDDASLELVIDPTLDNLSGVKLGLDNSRILYFPDSPSEGRDIEEFESEVKMTLQAIRDQLQNMTERLFQQERNTNDLKQTVAELKDDNMPVAKNRKKKSS
jgi:hypothetical protein